MSIYTLDKVDEGKWNANIHYHKYIMQNLPQKKQHAIDIGCGEGILTRQLAAQFEDVIGVDPHAASIQQARSLTTQHNANYLEEDFTSMDLKENHFDLVASVVAIHHMDFESALNKMKAITKQGGVLCIVGVSDPNYISDFVPLAYSFIAKNIMLHLGKIYRHTAPVVWPPPLSNKQTKNCSSEILQGSKFKKHLLNRYTILWQKPR